MPSSDFHRRIKLQAFDESLETLSPAERERFLRLRFRDPDTPAEWLVWKTFFAEYDRRLRRLGRSPLRRRRVAATTTTTTS